MLKRACENLARSLAASNGRAACVVRRQSADAAPTADSAGRAALDIFSSHFLGNRHASYTTELNVLDPSADVAMPIYQVLDHDGSLLDAAHEPALSEASARRMYEKMILLNELDRVMIDAQRQGRVSFYMSNAGEEATHMGSAAALRHDDLVFGQYREAGVLMWRGFTLGQFMNQCFGNGLDAGKGKAMPVSYGSESLNFVPVSSPLATQMPQAVGAAYALRRQGEGRVVVCYAGEGATSEGDAHAAFNFAATLDCPVVFFVRNNGFAISTPPTEQYRGDGIASRGAGYGLLTMRVDGNDAFAVYNATLRARQLAAANRPVLLEAMTYRLGHHSTSDDSSTYRSAEELDFWSAAGNPIARLRKYLVARGCWSAEREELWVEEARGQVLSAFAEAEKIERLPPGELFADVYATLPAELERQRGQMKGLHDRFPDDYPLNGHDK